MSYFKSIQKDKERAALPKVVLVGGIDVLIVSPEPGNPEPLYQVLRKQQVCRATPPRSTSSSPRRPSSQARPVAGLGRSTLAAASGTRSTRTVS